jgi:hypothetical protein
VEDEERRDAEEKREKAKVAAGPLPKPNDWQRAKVQQRRADPDVYVVDSTIPLKSHARLCAERKPPRIAKTNARHAEKKTDFIK